MDKLDKLSTELKEAMNINVSNEEYLESFYKQFNIFEEMSENKCKKIMYGDVVVDHGKHLTIGAWFK